jgi:hypothetical protein
MNPVFAAFDDLSITEMFFRVSGPDGIFGSPVLLVVKASPDRRLKYATGG